MMTEILKAFMKAKGEFPEIKKTKTNPFFKSKYAPLDVILAAVEPVLMANGLLLFQYPDGDAVVTTLYHAESGETMPDGRYSLCAAKDDPQGQAAAYTYGRRCAIMTYLGIAAEDDDGNSAQRGRQGSTDAPRTPPSKSDAQTGAKGSGSAGGGEGSGTGGLLEEAGKAMIAREKEVMIASGMTQLKLRTKLMGEGKAELYGIENVKMYHALLDDETTWKDDKGGDLPEGLKDKSDHFGEEGGIDGDE